MEIELDNKKVNVYITKKNNKNMYLRVKEDGIYISCNYLTPKSLIIKFIESNKETIIEALNRLETKKQKKESFYYLGKKYDVILLNTISKIEFSRDKVFVKNKTYLNTFLKSEAKRVFNNRVKVCYNLFEEDIPYPEVLIGKMTRKWGYCKKRANLIKLNFDLIKYDINTIDYVIVHELCHFIEFNHSKRFWNLVKKYKSDYKEVQRILKEE